MLAIGCDHGGFELKEEILKHLKERGIEYYDFGIYENVSVNYPEIGVKVARAVADKKFEKGIENFHHIPYNKNGNKMKNQGGRYAFILK